MNNTAATTTTTAQAVTLHIQAAPTMTCDDALMIMRADIARFCNEPQDPEMVAQADELGQAHYHRCCPCYGFAPLGATTFR